MRLTSVIVWVSLCIIYNQNIHAQDTGYFPPLDGSSWEEVSPVDLGWCEESIAGLNAYLDEANTKAFVVLKDGRIALEMYFDEFTADSVWYWASAGKTITATLTGIAQEEGLLSIDDPVSQYLGEGWTNCDANEEAQRTIYHQLTMSSGFNTFPLFWDCTEPGCFNCQSEPGTVWHYHNGVYRRLIEVIEEASGLTRNQYTTQKIKDKIGMGGFWFDNLYISTARDMARFGLLALNDYVWNGDAVLSDMAYIEATRSTAHPANEAYGYLWWLNGKESYYTPLDPQLHEGYLIPTAPADLYAGMGGNDQRVYVVPSQNLVVVRLGNVAFESSAAVSAFDELLWEHISNLPCSTVSTDGAPSEREKKVIITYPNPGYGFIQLQSPENYRTMRIFNAQGSQVWHGRGQELSSPIAMSSGFYILEGEQLDGKKISGKAVVY